MGSARKAALTALEKCRRSDAWSDAVLGSAMDAEKLQGRDRGLAAALCYGVVQNRMLLDHVIAQLSSISMRKIEPKVLDILRISIYQLLFMDRIPAPAAVNEAVKLCRQLGCARASGFVNAVLRGAVQKKYSLPEGDTPEALSIRYSHPLWLTELYLSRLGLAETEELLRCNNAEVPTALQVNTLKTDAASLLAALTAQGKSAEPHLTLPDCLLLHHGGELRSIPQFSTGDFYVQDPAAKLSVLAAAPEKGRKILDVCAAPGGKSFAAAIMSGNGSVISCDLHENKLKRIREGAERLGLTGLSCRAMDARTFCEEFECAFDLVIADVPCSGLGVIRKKPDIRYKDPGQFAGLPGIQHAILENVCRYVKPGGTLLYSTCTVRREENEDVVSAFLAEHPAFVSGDFELPGSLRSENGMLQLWPHKNQTDGFFIAKMRKQL